MVDGELVVERTFLNFNFDKEVSEASNYVRSSPAHPSAPPETRKVHRELRYAEMNARTKEDIERHIAEITFVAKAVCNLNYDDPNGSIILRGRQ